MRPVPRRGLHVRVPVVRPQPLRRRRDVRHPGELPAHRHLFAARRVQQPRVQRLPGLLMRMLVLEKRPVHENLVKTVVFSLSLSRSFFVRPRRVGMPQP